MPMLPILIIAALFFSNLIAFLDYDYRRVTAKGEALARRARAEALAAIPARIEYLTRCANSCEAVGQMIDARTFRNQAARLSAKIGG